jgi:hypothetical protein
MGKTSSEAKNKWCSANYAQIKISIKPDLAAKFKALCIADKTTVTAELSKFMANRCDVADRERRRKDLLTTRGGRRKLMALKCQEIEMILNYESEYHSRIPENLQGSVNYEMSEQCIEDIEEALVILERAY